MSALNGTGYAARTLRNLAPFALLAGGLILTGCAVDGGERISSTQQPLLSEVDCPMGYNVILGTQGRDILAGTAGNDCILGFGGNDNLTGKGGNDFIAGGTGDDLINGNQGDDVLYGEDGNDSINGGLTGNDTIYGGIGDDSIDGFIGNDTIYGEQGNDIIDGDLGDDTIFGDDGNDVIVDAAGTNNIDGGGGTDACTNGADCEQAEPAQTCTVNGDCAGGRTCNITSGVCVFCQSDTQCTSNQVCTPLIGCSGEGNCTDTIDNDADGDTDCNDSECASDSACIVGVRELAGGFNHQCVTSGVNIYCWGRNNIEQLGYPTTPTSYSNVAKRVVSLGGNPVQVTAGNYHTCALFLGQTVKCWGSNSKGSLGNNTTTNSQSPVFVTGLSGVTEIGAGGSHTCAILSNGTVQCWGFNANGQLGNGTTTDSLVPVPVSNITDALHIAAGNLHTCVVRTNGQLACWGKGANGRLGDGGVADSTVPVAVTGVNSMVFDQISVGQAHACARRNNGRVYCWGWNATGQLGDGTTNDRSSAAVVNGAIGIASVSAGYQHSCAMLSNGTIKCWGRNTDGQVGIDSFASPITTPQVVVSINTAARIGTGGWQSCARLQSGDVRCWGDNQYGAVGDGTLVDQASPQTVTGLP
jgi:alpha-tubulin suppressor-like RCC1 family protein